MNAPDPFLLHFIWPHGGFASNCPTNLECGEALIGEAAGAPDGMELYEPCYGRNQGRFFVGTEWPLQPAKFIITTQTPDGGLSFAREYEISDSAAIDFEYFVDRRQSTHLKPFETNKLGVEVLSSSGELLYRAQLPAERHLGICLDEPYGIKSTFVPTGTVRDRWLDRVVRGLPRLHRRTTAQGADSDFCLVFEDGALAVNLMCDHAWTALAQIIEECFHSAEDRLVASMALIGQKSVTNLVLDPMFFNLGGAHTYHSAHHSLMGPLSILRFGGGSAVCRAAVLAALLQRVHDPATGRAHS